MTSLIYLAFSALEVKMCSAILCESLQGSEWRTSSRVSLNTVYAVPLLLITPVSTRPLFPYLTTIIPLGIYFSQYLTGIFLILSQVLNRVKKSRSLTLMQSKDWLAFPTRKHIWLVLDLSIKMPSSPSLHNDKFFKESRKLYHLEYSLLLTSTGWVGGKQHFQAWPVDLNSGPPKRKKFLYSPVCHEEIFQETFYRASITDSQYL